MSINRPVKTTSENENKVSNQTSAPVIFARELGRIGIIGVGVGGGLYPIVVVRQFLYSNPSGVRSILFSGEIKGLFSFAGLKSTLKGSVLKNGPLSQRESLARTVEGKIEEQPVVTGAVVAGTIGTLDTTFSHYHDNQGTLNNFKAAKDAEARRQGLEKSTYETPKPKSPKEHVKFYYNGLPLRLSNNILGVSAFLIKPVVQSKLKDLPFTGKAFPEDARALTASVLVALPISLIQNINGIGYANKISAMTPSFETPSLQETLKNLYKINGLKAFGRGYGFSLATSGTALFLVGKMEGVSEKVIPAVEIKISGLYKSGMALFRKPKQEKPSTANAKPAAKKKRDYRAPCATR